NGNRSMKVVRVSGPQAWNWPPRLRPGRGVAGMSMGNAADRHKGPIEREVCWKIGRWPQCAFNRAPGEIGHDHVGGPHLVISDPAGLDYHQPFFTGDAAGIAEGVDDQAATNQLQVGLKDLFTKRLQPHGTLLGPLLAAAAILRSRGSTSPTGAGAELSCPKAKYSFR